MILTRYGLSSRKRPPPITDHLGLAFWVVAYGRFFINAEPFISRRSYTSKDLDWSFVKKQNMTRNCAPEEGTQKELSMDGAEV